MPVKTPQEEAIEIAKDLKYPGSVITALEKETEPAKLSHILCSARKAEAEKENATVLQNYYANHRFVSSTTRRWLI